MRPRTLVFITLLALCHLYAAAQALTNAAPAARETVRIDPSGVSESQSALPDDPGDEILPVAQPVPAPASGTPVVWQASQQKWAGDTVTLAGNVVFHYRDYVLRADAVTYNRKTTEIVADGRLQLAGGPDDVLIDASRGELRLDNHTARFYNVHGSMGVLSVGRAIVYSTPNPLLFSARVAIENGEGNYKLIDGSFTNCRIPHPDWRILAGTIALDQRRASTSNARFQFLGVPIFYIPYLRHGIAAGDRESGFLIPVAGNGSSIRGFTLGEQVYWAISRSMDMVVGAEYYSKRGWAPNGDFRYKGPGFDHFIARWNGLFDRGIEEATPTGNVRVSQGGADISAEGSKQLSAYTRVAGTAEYLSSYVYRLVFNDNYAQATSSQVGSDIAFTHARDGRIPSVSLQRFQAFASSMNGDEVRLLHLPDVRYDVLDRPLAGGRAYWGLASSLDYLSRSEPLFHARNVGRMDIYPRLTVPLSGGGWNATLEGALRDTSYTSSQYPDLTGANGGIPTISHDPLGRMDAEADIDIRPPALERDFRLPGNRELRHVIEPELTYRYVGGIGPKANDVLLFDTTDVAADTNQAGYSLTQHFYLRSKAEQKCQPDHGASGTGKNADANKNDLCPRPAREWATWQIAQDFYANPTFGGAVVPGQRNVFDSTLDLTGIAFLTSPRNLSPVISRLRFNAINNLRAEWDFDYDPIRGQMDEDNLFAGYSFGRTTVGLVHALLNAVDENIAAADASTPALGTLRSNEFEPFLEIGKPNGRGANLAVNGGYDFAEHSIQYAGAQAAYNWDCCGLSLGYRRFELGTVGTVSRDETQWLYGFTLANFGNVGDIRRANSIFRDPRLPPLY